MKSIHTKNAVCLFILISVSAAVGREYLLSALVGGFVQIVNLYFLERATAWMLGLVDLGGSGVVKALLSLRFVFLLLVCALLLVLLPVEPLGFAIGFSSVVPAALWYGLSASRSEAKA